jgi:hypothetical protein
MPAKNSISEMITISASALCTFVIVAGCTKKGSGTSPVPAAAPTASAPSTQPATPPQSGDGNSGTLERLFRYSLISSAGDVVFCQDFSSKTQSPLGDIETVADNMAMAQSQVPAGVINPFRPRTLGLTLKAEPCTRPSSLIKDGHCAVTASADTLSGKIFVTTQQRLLWKDVVVLAQANYNQSVIDQKTNAISGKNTLFETVQKQISQQQQFLNILQLGQQATTGQQSDMIKQAQDLLTSLQNQSQEIQNDIKKIEAEMIPYQDELKKSLEKLGEARNALKQACTPAGMGATSAEWTPN